MADEAVTHMWACDPGVDTGWAKGISHPDGALVITGYGYAPWKQVAIWLHDMVNGPDPCDEVIYESWRLTDKGASVLKGSDLPSSQFIGAMKQTIWLAQRNGILVRLAPEQAPERKYVVNGWFGEDYLPRDEKEHARDAIRHLVFRHTVTVGDGKPDPGKISISYLEEK